MICEQRDLPWAASVLAPLSFFSALDPPLALPRPALAALHRRWRGVCRPLNAIGQRIAHGWSRTRSRLRASLGLPRGRNPMTAGQFSPHLNLALFSRVIAAPQPDWPRQHGGDRPVRHDAVHGGLSDEIEQFLHNGPAARRVHARQFGGRAGRWRRIFMRSARPRQPRSDDRAILLVGHTLENRPATVSGDVLVADWAPHSELFHRAAAIVHQGGAGTLHTALAAGRPMLVVPFAYDQPDNARQGRAPRRRAGALSPALLGPAGSVGNSKPAG